MPICFHCDARKRADDPLQWCWIYDKRYLLHRGCQYDWQKELDNLPAGSKVLGKLRGGHRCEHCGSGRHVYRIQLPGEKEPAPRHCGCAGGYWKKMQEIPPDSGARHSGTRDYNRHIGSAEWKRFRFEITKQRGNRCERCGDSSAYLELHHKHYHSLGSEQPDDVELLCPKCHKGADETRAAKSRPKCD